MTQEEANTVRTVVRLEVDSYKRLRAARLTPTATGLIPVRGRNEAGKSSLIGAMLDALGAEKADMPITAGQDGAEVVVDLGDLIVRKRWSRGSSGAAKAAVTIEAADGSKISGPAGVLKSLRGRFADPVAFLDMTPAEQVKTVLGVLGLDDDLARLQSVADGLYERRRDLGREADRSAKAAAEIESEVAGLPDLLDGVPVESLTDELKAAKDSNAMRDRYRQEAKTAEERGVAATARKVELEHELESVEAQIVEQRERWTTSARNLASTPEIDVEPIVEKLRHAQEAAKVEGRRELAARTRVAATAAQEAHAEAEAELAEARNAISELLGSVEFPVEGMAYDHEAKVLTIDGIPFSQSSQAQRLKAAAAVAMAGSPSIRVLFAREGSLLDDESRLQLAQLAEAAGFQLWLEVVDSNPSGAGVWIEDGEAIDSESGE